MESASLGKLAYELILGVFKVILPDVAGQIEKLSGIATVLSENRSSHRAKRSLARHLEDAAGSLAERLEGLAAIEFPLPTDPQAREAARVERDLAVEGITKAFVERRPSSNDLIRRRLDAASLTSELEPYARAHWDEAALSEQATEFGRVFLASACTYLVRLVRLQPDFGNQVVWDGYLLTQRIHELLEAGMETIVRPRYREGTPREHSRFEAKYLSEVIDTFQHMELFGIDVPAEFRQQPIEVAYITLETSALRQYSPRSRDLEAEPAASHPTHLKERVDVALGRIADIAVQSRVGARVLLTGSAGSGKTTVAQWLAVHAAERQLPEVLAAWSDCIPFVVQLRHVFRGEMRVHPTDEDLLRISSYRASDIPGGWLGSVLNSRAALVVFDGLDELGPLHRSDAELWFTKFMRDHPNANIIVTSRPEGISDVWFKSRSFTHLTLEAMTDEDAQLCVRSWFNAIIPVTPRKQRQRYRQRETLLLHDLARQRNLRLLVETPLLCAMLCAFYAVKVDGTAPSSQAELYERVIKALIDTRERVRGSDESAPRNFDAYDKSQLLQAVARFMHDNNMPTIPLLSPVAGPGDDQSAAWTATTALILVRQRLAGLATSKIDPREALAYLVRRSIVFCKVGRDEAQFTHRTFQEYLAACDYAESDDLEVLLRHAHDPAWRRTITFTARAALPGMTSRLVEGLLDLAESQPGRRGDRRELLTLTAECLTAGGRVTPEVAERTRVAVADIVPPRNSSEADLFAPFGEGILPWLSNHEQEGDEVVAACVRAASQIAVGEALSVIEDYSKGPAGPAAIAAFLEAWSAFDPKEYAERVLNNLDLTGTEVRLSTFTPFQGVGFARTVRSIRLDVKDGLPNFEPWAGLDGLTTLDIGTYSNLESLAGLSRLTGLRKLNLSGSVKLTDFTELSSLCDLRELHLANCPGLTDPTPIAGLTNLRVLVLDNSRIRNWEWLSGLTALKSLSLNNCSIQSLEFCKTLTELRMLRVRPREGIAGTLPLGRCSDLRLLDLALSPSNDHELSLRSVEGIKELSIANARMADLSRIGAMVSLRKLRLSGLRGVKDLKSLSHLTDLRELHLDNCFDLVSGAGIGGLAKLHTVNLEGSAIGDVGFASSLTNLRELNLNQCWNLSDLSGLENLRFLRHLDVMGAGNLQGVEDQASYWASAGSLAIQHDEVELDYDDYYGPTS